MTTNLRLLPVALAAALAAGCSESTSTVAGTVKYRGKPLTGGSVTLLAVDGQIHSGAIGSDGKFKIDGVKSGTLKVGVTGPKAIDPVRAAAAGGRGDGERSPVGGRAGSPPPGGEAPPPPPVAPPGPVVPPNYSDPTSSGLTGQADGKPLDIDLK